MLLRTGTVTPIPDPAAPQLAEVTNALLDLQFRCDNMFILICAVLVFIMKLGFACLEAGLCQSKNSVNVMFNNTMVPIVGIIGFSLLGFRLMYPGFEEETGYEFAGAKGRGVYHAPADATNRNYGSHTMYTDYLFQAMFACACVSITHGCLAERVSMRAFVIFVFLQSTLIYPIGGAWAWGQGWLADLGFIDFAGCTLVHCVGGWAGLAAIILLGPRKGKYNEDGSVCPILPHNLPLATIGTLLLWFGWFGFNSGSVLSADPGAISYVATTTTMSAAAGGAAAAIASVIHQRKPDLSMTLNGILAGCVGITASAHIAHTGAAIGIGAVSGVLCYVGVLGFDKIHLDDPVGALSVHLVCGVFGTLVVGIPGLMNTPGKIWIQLLGTAVYCAFSFSCSFIIWLIMKLTIGIRVSEEAELAGLDAEEHGIGAYDIVLGQA